MQTGGLDSRLLGRVEITFYRYLRMLRQAQGLSVSISNLPEDPEGVAWMVAWGLQLDQSIKQELLGVGDLQELLLREEALLADENRMLYLLGQEDVRRRQPPENQGYISMN